MTTNKKVNLAIALLLAICLWVYVLLIDNPSTRQVMRNVPVNFLNEETLEEDGLVVIDKELESVSVSYSGQRSETDKVKAGDFKVTADLEGLKAGESTVRLFVSGPQSIKVDGTSPQKVKVVIDELVDEERPIYVRLVNQTSDDSEPHIVQVSEDAVMVRGARTFVNQVSYVRAEVDAAKVGNNLKALNIKLVPVNESGETVENVDLEFDSISVTTILHNKKTVSLTVPVTGNDDIYITREITVPKIITIKGTDENLEAVTSITCEPVDVSNIFESTTIPVVPVLPEGIEVAMNSEHLQVKVTAVDAGTRAFAFTENDVVLEGVTEGMMPIISDTEIQVKVAGNRDVVEAAVETDFSFSADISGLKPGEHVIPLTCVCANNLLSVEYNPKEITIVIEVKEDDTAGAEDSQQQEGQEQQPDQNEEKPGQDLGEGES
ncbi:MAG: hypothetical protein IJB73_08915 [Firmicutes bacterium]|nr:hypothetical protein [Bacillota bacterium]